MRRISALAALVMLLSFWTLPADAGTKPAGNSPEPLHLDAAVDAKVFQPSTESFTCTAWDATECGYISVDLTFSGFEGRAPMLEEGARPPFTVSGSARVTRTYGCQTPAGKRLRAYDTKVQEQAYLSEPPYGAQPFGFPQDGSDERLKYIAGYLGDAQPGNCPAGTEARLYRVVAKCVRVEFRSEITSVPSTTYRLRGDTWNGSVPTPALAS